MPARVAQENRIRRDILSVRGTAERPDAPEARARQARTERERRDSFNTLSQHHTLDGALGFGFIGRLISSPGFPRGSSATAPSMLSTRYVAQDYLWAMGRVRWCSCNLARRCSACFVPCPRRSRKGRRCDRATGGAASREIRRPSGRTGEQSNGDWKGVEEERERERAIDVQRRGLYSSAAEEV